MDQDGRDYRGWMDPSLLRGISIVNMPMGGGRFGR